MHGVEVQLARCYCTDCFCRASWTVAIPEWPFAEMTYQAYQRFVPRCAVFRAEKDLLRMQPHCQAQQVLSLLDATNLTRR